MQPKSRLKEDLTGKQFGEWTVLKYAGDYKWLCQCSCENKTLRKISRYDLIKSKTTNCGCKRHKDLLGLTFGRLVVKKYLGNMLWECECSCENHTIVKVYSSNLISGGTKSCGCLKNESRNSKEEYLKVIEDIQKQTGEPPYVDEISKVLNMHPENVKHNLEKYELLDRINKTFRSKPEREIADLIGKENIITNSRSILDSKEEIDIYIPDKKIAIEFNGTYWHSDAKIDKNYHQNKTIACAKQGIHLIHIFEYEWENNNKKEKIIKYLFRLLGKQENTIVKARDTEVKPIEYSETKEFEEKYHLQGSAKSTINLGIFLNSKLLGIMTFGPPRFNNNYQYEIIRLCYKDNVVIVGGTEKIFTHFLRTFNPDSIITYCDISKFTGNVYTRLGFKATLNPITEPSYVWANRNSVYFTRYETQKHKLIAMGLGTKDQTESQIMHQNGFLKVYDSGNLRLVWLKDNK